MKKSLQRGMTGQQIITVLERQGWDEIGSNGPHAKLRSNKTGNTILVPRRGRELTPGTFNQIAKAVSQD